MDLPHRQKAIGISPAPQQPRAPLRAVVLSDRPAAMMQALAALDILAIDATGADLALVTRDAPDMLLLDLAPGALSARRAALLVAQLRWSRPDLAVAVAAGRTAIAQGFPVDLVFDAAAPADALQGALATLRHILAHSRLRPCAGTGDAPALLRRATPRRATLFG